MGEGWGEGKKEDNIMKKRTVTYPLRMPASLKAAEFFASHRAKADIKAARRILRRRGGQPPVPEDRLP